jgi:DNA polymerase
LDVFRSQLDPYKVNAAATFGVRYEDVTKDQRQIGKVQELALGFLGGAGAFSTFGRIYGVHVSEADAQRMVQGWRRANPWAMAHGQALEEAIYRAMRNPGHEVPAGRVVYLYDRTHLWYALPSGRVLCYPFAKVEDEGVTYAKAAWKPAADAKQWPRARLWRGLACENITQATANDILRHALRRLEPHGVVLHVHDEVVLETPEPERVRELMTDVMTTAPDWAQGLPLAIEAEVMTRYSK